MQGKGFQHIAITAGFGGFPPVQQARTVNQVGTDAVAPQSRGNVCALTQTLPPRPIQRDVNLPGILKDVLSVVIRGQQLVEISKFLFPCGRFTAGIQFGQGFPVARRRTLWVADGFSQQGGKAMATGVTRPEWNQPMGPFAGGAFRCVQSLQSQSRIAFTPVEGRT